MDKLLFLAPYPTPDNIKDGMISRVSAIDKFAEDIPRTYLEVSPVRFRKKEVKRHSLATVYRLNAILHFWLIARLMLNAGRIYSHSIHGFTYIWQWLPFVKADVILDAHGVVPEEVRFFSKYAFRYPYYNFVERMVIKRAKHIIFVTNSMKRHFSTKYRKLRGQLYVYSIYPRNLLETDAVRSSNDDRVNVIYSGGISAWQNVDLMLQTIKANLSPRIKYTLLVNDKKYVLDKMSELGINHFDIEVDSVMPDQLAEYYSRADYAFILRDDNVVNRVANPTKIVEYLSYGIIPIVLSPEIGDYKEKGYEYLPLEKFSANIPKPTAPSHRNIEISKQLMNENARFDVKSLFQVN
jgi:hypothetical protein